MQTGICPALTISPVIDLSINGAICYQLEYLSRKLCRRSFLFLIF